MSQTSPTISHSQRLRGKIALVLPELQALGRALHTHPRIADLYPEYLFVTHCMVRATVPMMEAALERSRRLAPADPVAAAMVPYLEKHIPEEMHDHWPLEDLEVLGRDRATVLQRLPPPAVAAMIGAQYYWIQHTHPVALFAYMELAEGYPPSSEQVDALIAATGYPREAFRSLARHAVLDIEHGQELHDVLDRLPLTPAQQTLIGLNAMETVQLSCRVFRELLARAA